MSELAPALALALLHSLWQNALLAAIAIAVLEGMARSGAAWRHGVGMAFLIMMVIVPLMQLLGYWSDGFIDRAAVPILANLEAALRQWSKEIAPITIWTWVAGAFLMLVRRSLAARAIAAMERAPFTDLPAPILRRLDALSRALQISHVVACRVSNEVIAPCVTGLFRIIVWLPTQLITGLTPAQIEAILAHELAHAARRDWLWNALQCGVECLLFFNPAVWLLSRRVRQERERACDELAVSVSGDAVALAEALAALEGARRAAPQLRLAANGGALLSRVRLLLGESLPRKASTPIFTGILCAMTLVFGLTCAIGGHPPDLVVQVSTSGPLGPRNHLQISSHDRSGERFYRLSLGKDGRSNEVYRVDGQPRPIDTSTRRWIEAVLESRAPPEVGSITY
jgi:beta-lactamase regulating signal transducer with metallopeptidase domain